MSEKLTINRSGMTDDPAWFVNNDCYIMGEIRPVGKQYALFCRSRLCNFAAIDNDKSELRDKLAEHLPNCKGKT